MGAHGVGRDVAMVRAFFSSVWRKLSAKTTMRDNPMGPESSKRPNENTHDKNPENIVFDAEAD